MSLTDVIHNLRKWRYEHGMTKRIREHIHKFRYTDTAEVVSSECKTYKAMSGVTIPQIHGYQVTTDMSNRTYQTIGLQFFDSNRHVGPILYVSDVVLDKGQIVDMTVRRLIEVTKDYDGVDFSRKKKTERLLDPVVEKLEINGRTIYKR